MSYPAPPPPPAAPPQPRRAGSHWYKSRWAIGIGAFVLGAAIAGGSAGAANNDIKTKTVAGPATTATVTAAPEASVVTEVVPSGVKTVTVTGHPITATHTRTVRVTYTPPPKAGFSDGTYLVGSDIKPGLYRTNGRSDSFGGCYWERDKDLRGGVYSINANDNIDGPTVVQIFSSDRAFKVNGGCSWHRS